MKFVLWIILLCFYGFIYRLDAGTVERIYISDNKPALKGSNIQLVCDISQFGAQVAVLKTDSRLPDSISGIQPLTFCVQSFCFTTSIGRYTFSADSSKIYINITNLNRSEDQKWWACAVGNERKDVQLTVSMRVSSVTLIDGPGISQESLQVVGGVLKTLTCKTSVSRPVATIVWYIGTVEKQRSSYSPYFTFIPQNSDHNKQICCKAFNIQQESQSLTSNKTTLFVQVRVTSVTLKDGTSLLPESLQVESGVPKTLTCTTSASRPVATVVWYVGTVEKQRSSSSFTLIPQNSDHNKQIYCKAFNIQPESQAVTSNKATLYVKVRVTSVTLKYDKTTPSGTLDVTSGISITLTCTTSASRPTATLIWFIGTEEKKRSTGSTSSLTFTPDNSDHGHHVYCKAFNLQTENQAVISSKPSLFVKEPTVVKSFYTGERNSQPNVTVDEHDVTQFTCEVSGDPASNVKITFKGEILAEQVDTNELTFTHPDVDCFHSGIYTCEGNDSNGRTSSMSTTLLVKCSPRPLRQIPGNITSPLHVPVTLMFTAMAYPEPGPEGFSWYKENWHRWLPLLSNEDFHVSSCGLQTSLTILNVSRASFGQYRVTVENDIGTYDQYLFLSEGLPVVDTAPCKCDKESTALLIVAVIVGIISVVLAAYATGITILYKRKTMSNGKRYSDRSTSQTTYVNTVYKPNDKKEQETTQRREITHNASGTNEDSLLQYTDLTAYSRDDKTTYDIIKTE